MLALIEWVISIRIHISSGQDPGRASILWKTTAWFSLESEQKRLLRLWKHKTREIRRTWLLLGAK